jgi:hypothetical protein
MVCVGPGCRGERNELWTRWQRGESLKTMNHGLTLATAPRALRSSWRRPTIAQAAADPSSQYCDDQARHWPHGFRPEPTASRCESK